MELKDVVNNLGDRQDILRGSELETVHLMTNLSQQWELMRDNQKIQLNNLVALKELYQTQYQTEYEFEVKVDNDYTKMQLKDLFLSIQVQFDKLRNAILFLKTGVVDPYLMDPQELLAALTRDNVGYDVQFADIDTILNEIKPDAVFDSVKKVIHIMLKVPVSTGELFNLYENLVVPKVVNDSVVVLDGVSRFLVLSLSNMKFIESDDLKCISLSNVSICKKLVTRSVKGRNTCVMNIFFDHMDDGCVYKHIRSNFQAHDVVNAGFLVFSAVNLTVDLICPNFTDTQVLMGSSLFSPPNGCGINSTIFELDGDDINNKLTLENKTPLITCCSKFYRLDRIKPRKNNTLVLQSFHDIHSIQSDGVNRPQQPVQRE